ncbi:hypothetical protein C8J56DRAFT_1043404 [Mycena floridula]|nr:hypothetical protein C8J56DRAFT_1043404 [Mycena floridula]
MSSNQKDPQSGSQSTAKSTKLDDGSELLSSPFVPRLSRKNKGKDKLVEAPAEVSAMDNLVPARQTRSSKPIPAPEPVHIPAKNYIHVPGKKGWVQPVQAGVGEPATEEPNKDGAGSGEAVSSRGSGPD